MSCNSISEASILEPSAKVGGPLSCSSHYIDFRFSDRKSSPEFTDSSRTSMSESFSSEDFIDLYFPHRPDDARDDGPVYIPRRATKHPPVSADIDRARYAVWSEAGVEDVTSRFKELQSPRVSEDALQVDVEDFYMALTVGLDSLRRAVDSAFLSADFLEQAVNFLRSVDGDVRALVEKLGQLRGPGSEEFREAAGGYRRVATKMLEVCNALTFSTALQKAYRNVQVEAAVGALEALVSLSRDEPRAVHVARARRAGLAIEACVAEMTQMRKQVTTLVESASYGSLLSFVPDLNLPNAHAAFPRWSGLWGVVFAARAVASYVSQLLLAALAHGGEGPAIVASADAAAFRSEWSASLMNFHVHARRQFNRARDDECEGGCTSFMGRDCLRLEWMLQDTDGHLKSLLDQGKFLNMGAYIGSWRADRKKLAHNVPLLRQHLANAAQRLSVHVRSLESLSADMLAGKKRHRHLLDAAAAAAGS